MGSQQRAHGSFHANPALARGPRRQVGAEEEPAGIRGQRRMLAADEDPVQVPGYGLEPCLALDVPVVNCANLVENHR